VTRAAPEPFRLHVPDQVLADLRERLARTRWPDEIPDSGWRYGSNLAFMRRLVDHWRDGFDWRSHEEELNRFDQYTVELGGIDLHFIHQPGIGPAPLPLLLVNGWPCSVWEFHELIPRLTDPERFGGDPADAFTVIAPSLPCYTLSYAAGQPRFDVVAMADLFAELMTDVLGYGRFCAQGGDWGSYVVALLAARHAETLHGIHLNLMPVKQDLPFPAEPNEEEERYRRDLQHWQAEETGYHAIQGTKPQTIAYALTDSPAGLAAWIVEKFHTWTDHDGELEQTIDFDSLLANITLYWATEAINSSFWPYYAIRHEPWPLPEGRIDVPTAYASFPRETRHPARSFAEPYFNIERWTEMPRGGHYAALEVPDALAADVVAFFRGFRGRPSTTGED
jgi:pimeloyl-ACP methyl ester carboxylesterase